MPYKFCIQLQKSAREMYEKLKRAYEEQTWSKGEVFDGTMTVWKSRMLLKMNHIQEDLSRKQQMKTKVVAYVEVWSTFNIETDSRSIELESKIIKWTFAYLCNHHINLNSTFSESSAMWACEVRCFYNIEVVQI